MTIRLFVTFFEIFLVKYLRDISEMHNFAMSKQKSDNKRND